MRLRGVLLAASLLATPMAAGAQPVQGVYIGAGAGYNRELDLDTRASPGLGTPALNFAPGNGYAALFLDRALLPLWIATFAFGFSISCRMSFVAPFAYRRGIASVGLYFSLYGEVAVVMRLSGSLMDRLGLDRMLAPTFAVMGLGIALIALTGHFAMLEVAALIGGLGHGFAYPVLSAIVIRDTPQGRGSRVSTIYTSMWDVSGMIGPFALGFLARYAGYAPMFVAAGAVAIGAALYLEAARRGGSWAASNG
jgi:MFS family permease